VCAPAGRGATLERRRLPPGPVRARVPSRRSALKQGSPNASRTTSQALSPPYSTARWIYAALHSRSPPRHTPLPLARCPPALLRSSPRRPITTSADAVPSSPASSAPRLPVAVDTRPPVLQHGFPITSLAHLVRLSKTLSGICHWTSSASDRRRRCGDHLHEILRAGAQSSPLPVAVDARRWVLPTPTSHTRQLGTRLQADWPGHTVLERGTHGCHPSALKARISLCRLLRLLQKLLWYPSAHRASSTCCCRPPLVVPQNRLHSLCANPSNALWPSYNTALFERQTWRPTRSGTRSTRWDGVEGTKMFP
jgi:hypothetical protein